MTTHAPSIDVRLRAPATVDELVVDGALWRAHHRLGAVWLHTFRGAMNAISLSAQLVARRPGTDSDTAMKVIRGQLQELDAGLSRLLVPSYTDDACDIGDVLERIRLLVAPLARQRGLELDGAVHVEQATAQMGGAVCEAVLLPLLVDVVSAAGAPGRLALTLTALDTARLLVDVRAEGTGGGVTLGTTPFTEAAQRLVGARGGALKLGSPGESPVFSLLVRRVPERIPLLP